MIDVVLLGSGATMPTPYRGVSAAALQCAGRSILFDCGEGTQVALRREKVSPNRIDLIALTHYHGDHVFGLPGLLQTMNCLKRLSPLFITGPDGLEEFMASLLSLTGALDFEIRLLSSRDICLQELHKRWPGGALLQRVPTAHRVPSQGYSFLLPRAPAFLHEKARRLGIPTRLWKQIHAGDPSAPILIDGKPLEADGHIVRGADVLGGARAGLHVVFSGDTEVCSATRACSQGADLLIHDATYGEDAQEAEAKLWGHSTFRQAAVLAKEASVKRLWLTHFSQSMTSPEEHVMNAKAVFENTVCGYDGLSITLNYED